MEKAIAHPRDSRFPERCRQHLVKAAAGHGLTLRRNYNREAPRLAGQTGRSCRSITTAPCLLRAARSPGVAENGNYQSKQVFTD
jgi:hypothetical protein